MTLYPITDSFVRGEISPRLHSRASLDLYKAALSRCRNFLTLPHGGLRKRGGTYYVAPTKISGGKVRLIEFVYSADQAYCLEFGNLYCRVYAYGAYLGVEFVTPWAAADLDGLQYVQSADVMWIVHPNYAPRRIVRQSAMSWVVQQVSFTDGPFAALNLDTNKTAYVSGITGSVTITANTGIFSASDVGRLFRIEMTSYNNVNPWEPGGLFVLSGTNPLGRRVRYDGNVYACTNSGATIATNGWRFGATPPTHTEGIQPDGPELFDQALVAQVGAKFEYLHSGFGVAVITGYSSPTIVTATVISRFPEEVVNNATYRYRFGAFSPGNYPVAVTLYEERLAFASKLSVYASKTGDFSSFKIGEKDDDALEFLLAANEANEIVWLADSEGFLIIGTIGGVRALSGSGLDEALTPSSFKNRSSSTPRCSPMRPINTGQTFLYVANGYKTFIEMALNGTSRFEGVDAMQISEHIAKQCGGIASNSYQENPDPTAWLGMENGEVVGFTYQPDQAVRGFHRHLPGGTAAMVEDVCVTPGRTGTDDVWLVVSRTINGTPRKYIELLTPAFEYGAKKDVFAVDCGLSYSGSPVNSVTGLAHLEGSSVSVLADGVPYTLTVSGAAVSLPGGKLASTIHVGLPFEAEAETLELDVGGRDGSVQGRRKRINKVILSLLETDLSGLKIQSMIRKRWEQAKITTETVGDGSMQLYTGNIEVPIDDSWQGQGRISISHTGPGPCTVRSIVPAFDSEGA